MRRGTLVLIPGDSPMGLRLPLEALTWREPPPPEPELSPFADRSPLESPESARAQPRPKAKEAEPEEVPRGALCVEARRGKLFVFLPPVERLEHAVDLQRRAHGSNFVAGSAVFKGGPSAYAGNIAAIRKAAEAARGDWV